MSTTPTSIVALFGQVGNGKTSLLNKLTGQHFPVSAGGVSCTIQLQYGFSRRQGICIVDTPGFFASSDVAAHIGAQQIALEGRKLSGIYLVAKCGRADVIARESSEIMDFVGGDDFRLILTHEDIVQNHYGYDKEGLTETLSKLLNMPTKHIFLVGNGTHSSLIENFIQRTLHKPRAFQVSAYQVAKISSKCGGPRMVTKFIQEVEAKVAAAGKDCEVLTNNGRSQESDQAILLLQSTVHATVIVAKEEIFREADEEDFSPEMQCLIYGKAGLSMSLMLKEFVETTNKLLSWDVSNLTDPRNHYRKCNFCGAVFNKTEGCDDMTTCGSVPKDTKRPRPNLTADFYRDSEWMVEYFWNNQKIQTNHVLQKLKEFSKQSFVWGGGKCNTSSKLGATFESGCGAAITWATMEPVDPELIEMLGQVELCIPGDSEDLSKSHFLDRLTISKDINRGIIDDLPAD
jgi:50S ribosome-binding GTPase